MQLQALLYLDGTIPKLRLAPKSANIPETANLNRQRAFTAMTTPESAIMALNTLPKDPWSCRCVRAEGFFFLYLRDRMDRTFSAHSLETSLCHEVVREGFQGLDPCFKVSLPQSLSRSCFLWRKTHRETRGVMRPLNVHTLPTPSLHSQLPGLTHLCSRSDSTCLEPLLPQPDGVSADTWAPTMPDAVTTLQGRGAQRNLGLSIRMILSGSPLSYSLRSRAKSLSKAILSSR